jgi:hypothetical protein
LLSFEKTNVRIFSEYRSFRPIIFRKNAFLSSSGTSVEQKREREASLSGDFSQVFPLGYTMAFMPRALAKAANAAISTLMMVFQALFISV